MHCRSDDDDGPFLAALGGGGPTPAAATAAAAVSESFLLRVLYDEAEEEELESLSDFDPASFKFPARKDFFDSLGGRPRRRCCCSSGWGSRNFLAREYGVNLEDFLGGDASASSSPSLGLLADLGGLPLGLFAAAGGGAAKGSSSSSS